MIERFHGDESKINACAIKEHPGMWEDYWQSYHNTREFMEDDLQRQKSVLMLRLSDETFRGIFNFLKATIPDTPIDKIEKALVS